jgi:adenosylcobinamide kinase / adenosylcobinamide-phosphate guanylyltransferase
MAQSSLILVGGGARSGKSAFALTLARQRGKRRVLIATARADDDEMTERIARHRNERGPDFLTVEEPVELPRAVSDASDVDVVVIDCLTLWLSNLLANRVGLEQALARVDWLVQAAATGSATVIVVTNEIGMGIVPMNPLARSFRDLAGHAHQRLAAAAAEIYLAVVGTVVRIRPGELEVAGIGGRTG